MCHFSDCGINWTAGGLCQRNGGLPRARKFCTHCGLHSDECCIFTLTCYLHHHSGAAQRNRQVSFYFIHKWSYALNRHQRRTYSLLIPQGEIQLHTLLLLQTHEAFWIHMHMHWGRGDRVRVECLRQAPWVFGGLASCSRVPWQCFEDVLQPAHLSKFGLQPEVSRQQLDHQQLSRICSLFLSDQHLPCSMQIGLHCFKTASCWSGGFREAKENQSRGGSFKGR